MQRVLNPAVERLDRDALLRLQMRRLSAQLARAGATVPFYRRRWGFNPEAVTSLERLRELVPTTTKADFLNGLPESDGRVAEGTVLFQHHMTSGTTGLGQETHPLSAADHEALAAGWHYQAHWAGLERGDKICFTWPTGLQTGGLSTGISSQRLGLEAIQLGPYSSEDKLRYMDKFQPQALVASPSYLSHLQFLLEAQGTTPAKAFPALKALFIAGESYPLGWAEDTQEAWAATVSEWYGLMQGGFNQAFSCESGVVLDGGRGALHHLDHRLLAEILDPETGLPAPPGGSGEIFLTTLTRDAFPIIRFRTGDKVTIQERPCPCGRPFLCLEAGTVARYDDMLKVRGQNLWPAAVDSVLLTDVRVVEYAGTVQLDERARELVSVQVELAPELHGVPIEAEVLADLRHRVKSVTNVSMDFVSAAPDSLPRFEFKARRWTDLRRQDRQTVRYVARG
ncbi:phenylacetate--CoA ligase family protein [Micromonospora sp. NPDC005161]